MEMCCINKNQIIITLVARSRGRVIGVCVGLCVCVCVWTQEMSCLNIIIVCTLCNYGDVSVCTQRAV